MVKCTVRVSYRNHGAAGSSPAGGLIVVFSQLPRVWLKKLCIKFRSITTSTKIHYRRLMVSYYCTKCSNFFITELALSKIVATKSDLKYLTYFCLTPDDFIRDHVADKLVRISTAHPNCAFCVGIKISILTASIEMVIFIPTGTHHLDAQSGL